MKTITLQGKQYAQVKERLNEFRSKNPQGLIETTPLPQDDGSLMFKARIVVDKSNPASAEATGHSYSKAEKISAEKGFEKLETIAVGRALALLGYAADGEIASSEEMEEFLEHQEKKKANTVLTWGEKLESVKTLDDLKAVWADMPIEAKEALKVKKDEMKAIISTENKPARVKKPVTK
jgi:hypothetical protein